MDPSYQEPARGVKHTKSLRLDVVGPLSVRLPLERDDPDARNGDTVPTGPRLGFAGGPMWGRLPSDIEVDDGDPTAGDRIASGCRSGRLTRLRSHQRQLQLDL